MTNSSSFFAEIDKGREGKNWGYSLGLSKLDDLTGGLTKGTYTLLFASSGTGKSSAALYSYVYSPLKEHLEDDKLNIVFIALEMKTEYILAKLLSLYLLDKYHIRVSAKEILSQSKDYTLPDDIYEKIQESKEWVDKVCKVLTIVDKAINSDSLYSLMLKKLEKEGKFDNEEDHTGYHPNNPDKVILFIIDHLGLIRTSNGRSKKQEIDRASSMMVSIRNRTNMSFLVIMQSNRAVANVERHKAGMSEAMIEDIKDSGSPSEDCEICLAVYNPAKDHKKSYRDWDVQALDGMCRSLICLKNRYGEANTIDFCYFDGKTGWFAELPKPNQIYDYSKYSNPLWCFNEDRNENVDTQKETFKFKL